jgi:hypothetical protein
VPQTVRKYSTHLGVFVTSMRKKPVIFDAYAKTSSDPPQKHGHQKCLPAKKEERSQSADVKRNNDASSDPHDRLRKCFVVRED